MATPLATPPSHTLPRRTGRGCQPLVRKPEVDVPHGSRLWPCGCYRRRGEIVGSGSLGMVRPRGSPLRVLRGVGGEMEFSRVPTGTTPQSLGPRPGGAPKSCACVGRTGLESGSRCYACAKSWSSRGETGLASLPPPLQPPACGSQTKATWCSALSCRGDFISALTPSS